MTARIRIRICLAALGLALALAACGSAREAKTHHVDIRLMQYVPAELSVAVGDTVVWTNHDVVPHTVTSVEPSAASFDSGQLAANQQWQMKVTAAGVHPYVCTFHPTMRATVVAR
jgi:plastocyanin